MAWLKKVAARLPGPWQAEIKRLLFRRQILRGTFATDEPEYTMLPQLVQPGDWVIDIGANVGHYAKRLSELAGPQGRVIAMEPTPTTFALLAANAQHFAHPNVTLINAAVSDRTDLAGITVPHFDSGLPNYYEARLTPSNGTGLSVLTLAIDALRLCHRIALVKIDAEDHEASVLAGMQELLRRDRPVLIVETGNPQVVERLQVAGYAADKPPGSPNFLFRPTSRQELSR